MEGTLNDLLRTGIAILPDRFRADECAAWIASAAAEGFEEATVSTRKGALRDESVRNNSRVVRDDVALAAMVWRRLRDHVPAFLDGRQATGINERFRFYRYAPGERFAGHVDGAYRRANGEESRLTLMIYLNDDFTGGETAFAETVVTPRRGTVLLFRHALFHEGRPVGQGIKYVLRSDVMFNPPGRISG
jgi:predicted 2-oxoglutarate/Fe(II)-dependent dioxygenase YbiX